MIYDFRLLPPSVPPKGGKEETRFLRASGLPPPPIWRGTGGGY